MRYQASAEGLAGVTNCLVAYRLRDISRFIPGCTYVVRVIAIVSDH